MLSYISGVRNQLPFYYFEQISKIPRASKNEAQIAKYLIELAKSHNLECYYDEHNNVLIKKNGTQGRENEPAIMLQAHTDMVAEKNVATEHNFDTDEIKLVQEDNILRAEGTTLGADDGFGVAIMLAALTDDTLSHPPLECLFTSSEEIGLVGAGLFDYSKISAKRMINLDSAEENTVIIGCCGGIRTELSMPTEAVDNKVQGIKIKLGGLCGGHSGEDIDRGRLNSNILMGQLIKELGRICKIKIAYMSGGDKDNAIPRECEAIIVPESDQYISTCVGLISIYRGLIEEKIKAREDQGLYFTWEIIDTPLAFSYETTEKILKILSVPNGVISYRTVEPILPEFSRNLARVRVEDGRFNVGFSSRSYLEERLDYSCGFLDNLAREVGATTMHHERYPGWQSPADSDLVVAWQNAYKTATGNDTKPTLIHAGLECGLMSSKILGLCAISVGCNVHDLHTPKETMEIDSMDRIYDTVSAVLKIL
ncbi:MAG: beta-Ala-His dipeptidase [Clostridia bacterium]|nr:beta-Ala-His dipeptidase [Clostridia bacterium]